MCVQTSDEINKVKKGDNSSKNGPIKNNGIFIWQ